ncbi:MAG TPA: ribosome maturation factor RimP [Acidimicrobiia bacterium]|nr:ribosome maturation factor RimP [Acidimicrobiia bacterium]
MATETHIWKVVEPYLAAEKLELDDLELVGRGRALTLRVVVDGEGGLDLDRIAEVARGLSRLLDSVPELEGPYQLEVTSPGLERKLTRPSHFAKSLGREVVAKTSSGSADPRTIKGILTDAGESGFVITGEADQVETIPYDQVLSARTIFRWEKAPKPGQARRQP